ncbi:MAG: DUF45 domain-containing protein, partial [Atopobiaceae bacterium]|nr:DUF45 domain-containing protein [Atopobiaceae bacterium]
MKRSGNVTTLQVGEWCCEVCRKRIRNLYLKVGPDGTLSVSAPLHTSDATIRRFVTSRAAWVMRRMAAVEAHPSPDTSGLVDGSRLSVWGHVWTLEVRQTAHWSVEPRSCPPDVAAACGTVLLGAPSGASEAARRKRLLGWYRLLLEPEADRCFLSWQERSGLAPDSWHTRVMRSRWGSCAPGTRRISLNVHLAEYPP